MFSTIEEKSRHYCGGGTLTTTGQVVASGLVTGETATAAGYLYLELDPNAGGNITYGTSGHTSTPMFPGSPPLVIFITDPSSLYVTNAGSYSVAWALYR